MTCCTGGSTTTPNWNGTSAEIARRTDLAPGANFLEGGQQVLALDFLF